MQQLTRTSFLALLCLLLCVEILPAQVRDSANYTRRHFTDVDGLPQNSINAIMADEAGFLWMLTEDGVVRFDGNNFVPFNKANLNGIKSNRMMFLYHHPDGSLFAVSDQQDCLHISRGRIRYDPQGAAGLAQLNRQFGTKSVMELATGLPRRLNYLRPDRLVVPFVNKRYTACYKDHATFFGYGKDSVVVPYPVSQKPGYFVLQDHLYFHSPDGHFSMVDTSGFRSSVALTGDLLKDSLYPAQKEGIMVFWNINAGNVLLYFNSGFYLLKKGRDNSISTKLIFSEFNIDRRQIISSYYDEKNDRLFLGSLIRGLYVLEKRNFRVMAEGRRNQLDAYYALIPYDSNSVLMPSGVQMGMDAEGRTYLDRKREDLNEQYTIARDKNGFFWIRDGKGSLHQCDRELNYMRSWAVKLNTKVLFVDSSNTLWIGTEKRGLIAMDLNDFDPKPIRMFPAPNIGCITADKHAQVIWFGGAKGLYRLDKRSRKVDEFHALKNKSVRSLYAVSEQEVWITTYEDGIYLYLDGRIIALPHDRENLLSSAHCMIRDAEDQFWITTNKGLFIALRNDLLEYARGMRAAVYYHYYSKEKGFNTNEFNGGCEPCGTLLANGNILFPSLDGIVCALPQKVEKDFPTGPLMADRVEIDNQWISFTGDTLRLPTRFDVLKLHFAMLYFGNKKNIQLTYSLLKAGQSSSEWYPVSADNVISFSTLASGTYKLHIRKMNGFGKDNFSERVITIIIPERFFETTWFKILVLAGMLLLVYAYFRIRVLYIIKSNRMLELRIARRTRKLMSTLRALESSEQSLRQQTQIQEMLIAAISHDIKSPMKYLLLTSKKMQQFIQKKEYEAIPVFNEGIRETAEHVYGILDNLLKYITIQLKQGTVKPEHLDLRALITEKAETFKNIAANNNTVIENNVAPQSSIYCNRDLLAVVVHNLLDNAVKYTANGSISVNYYARERMLAIDDTGTGIGEELQHWINSPMDDQKVRVDTASGHKGMGLIIVKELLKALGATIKVGTRDSGGTWVHILFSEQHYEGII